MDNSNIIISIIIVLCIAAGVTAYSLTNNDSNNVFTDLQGFTPDSGDAEAGTDGVQNGTTTGASSGSSSGASSGTSSGSGSGSGGSGGGSSGGGGSGGGGTSYITPVHAKAIAASCVEESGCYVGSAVRSGNTYYCSVYNQNGQKVDCILVNAKTGAVIGRG